MTEWMKEVLLRYGEGGLDDNKPGDKNCDHDAKI